MSGFVLSLLTGMLFLSAIERPTIVTARRLVREPGRDDRGNAAQVVGGADAIRPGGPLLGRGRGTLAGVDVHRAAPGERRTADVIGELVAQMHQLADRTAVVGGDGLPE